MPEDERVLLFLLAHASNEINVFPTLLTIDESPTPIFNVRLGQAFMLARLLIGKLHEVAEIAKFSAARADLRDSYDGTVARRAQ
jgi:hypothetical protein